MCTISCAPKTFSPLWNCSSFTWVNPDASDSLFTLRSTLLPSRLRLARSASAIPTSAPCPARKFNARLSALPDDLSAERTAPLGACTKSYTPVSRETCATPSPAVSLCKAARVCAAEASNGFAAAEGPAADAWHANAREQTEVEKIVRQRVRCFIRDFFWCGRSKTTAAWFKFFAKPEGGESSPGDHCFGFERPLGRVAPTSHAT